ncbi:hypothetical protein FC764_08205 [Clostridium botulinum]|uniref:hypothetical protein n=1 Tax=Clostridium botulinum TaxID=1491 RepID=UPI0013F8E75F|nr:hypothetical protein [Clostridium botulinum]MBN1057867.1 hypothetical protein [Clostridium botulinum]MBN1061112.1 hypothetical protein [Clostridium botulinum]NFF81217.1 hypothetical protein [Clostridium botulinum]
MKIYEGLGLQEEYDVINSYYEIEDVDYNDKEAYKKFLMKEFDESITKDSKMLKNMFRVSLELFLFYLDKMEHNPNKLIEVINNLEYRLVKGNQEISFQSMALNKKLDSCDDIVDKNNIMNTCMKRYQDMVENASKNLSLFMEISNIKETTYTNKDMKNTLNNKIKKLQEYEDIHWILSLINRGLRNKIGHFDVFYDFKDKVFKDYNKNIICTYSEFHEDNLNIAAFEYGFMATLPLIALLSWNEVEFLEEYISKIRKYVGI